MMEVTGSMSMEDMTKAMTSDNAKCQMSWNTPGDNLTMFCWWKGNDPDAINKQLESMNDFYEPHKFVECTDDVIDFNAKQRNTQESRIKFETLFGVTCKD